MIDIVQNKEKSKCVNLTSSRKEESEEGLYVCTRSAQTRGKTGQVRLQYCLHQYSLSGNPPMEHSNAGTCKIELEVFWLREHRSLLS